MPDDSRSDPDRLSPADRPGRFHELTCLIVGGTGGIGQAVARLLLREAARVAVTGHAGEEVQAAERELRLSAGDDDQLVATVLDVTDPDEVDRVFGEVAAWSSGRVDVLVHVAGISGRRFGDGSLTSCTVDGWDETMRVNARGVFLTNRAAARQMLSQARDHPGSRGCVVNIGSVLASHPSPLHFDTIAYAASKGAIQSLTLAAAARHAADGIRFNLIAPGLIDSPMSARAVSNPQIVGYLRTKQPLSAGPGRAIDVAEAVLYLASPASAFVTGIVLEVDGGWHLCEGSAHEAPSSSM